MPDNFPHSTISWVVFANKIKNIALQKEPIFLLNGEVIWQASDSPLSKELHVFAVHPLSAGAARVQFPTKPTIYTFHNLIPVTLEPLTKMFHNFWSEF